MRKRLTIAVAVAGCISISPVVAGERLTFEKDVRPIFKAYCLDCHGAGEVLKGHLDLRLKRFRRTRGRQRPGGGRGSARREFARRAAQERRNAAG